MLENDAGEVLYHPTGRLRILDRFADQRENEPCFPGDPEADQDKGTCRSGRATRSPGET